MAFSTTTTSRPRFTFLSQNAVFSFLPFSTRQKLVSRTGSSHLRQSNTATPFTFTHLEVGARRVYLDPTLIFEFRESDGRCLMFKRNICNGAESTIVLGVDRKSALKTLVASYCGKKGTRVKYLEVKDAESLHLVAHLTPEKALTFEEVRFSTENRWDSLKILCLQVLSACVYSLPYITDATEWEIVYWIDWPIILQSKVRSIKYGCEIRVDRVAELVEKWQNERRSVGTSFKCQFYKPKIEDVARWPGAVTRRVVRRGGDVRDGVVVGIHGADDRVIVLSTEDLYQGFMCTTTLLIEVLPVGNVLAAL